MVKYGDRSSSRSPRRRSRTPPRGRERYEDDHRRHGRSGGNRESPPPSGLLIRNLSLHARPEDLRASFERFGPVKDVYLPRNYYTGVPRGFGFVKFCYPEDAAEAKQRMNYRVIGGREMRIVFAEENRKTPQEMRMVSNMSAPRRGGSRSLPKSPRRRYHSYSSSLSPAGRDTRGRDHLMRDDDIRWASERELTHVSHLHSPFDKRDYRLQQLPPSPRPTLGECGQNLRDERNYGRKSRSRSPEVYNDNPSRSHPYAISPH